MTSITTFTVRTLIDDEESGWGSETVGPEDYPATLAGDYPAIARHLAAYVLHNVEWTAIPRTITCELYDSDSESVLPLAEGTWTPEAVVVDRTEHLYDYDNAEDLGVATAEQIAACDNAPGEVILIDADGDVIAPGSWDAQQRGVRSVYTS